ncbi:hypothetical protein RJ641_013263 [Dillenia turbinata]|uniref:Protein LNK1 n=1 Tax=Dillenia turbinata TaxID=194707 RepID=A0AAN8ZL94_9MAGN
MDAKCGILEDIIGDEFNECDDHIVPHPRDKFDSELRILGVSCKKPRHEGVVGYTSDTDKRQASKHATQGGGETSLPSLKSILLEKGSWTHTLDGVFPTSCGGDSVKDVTSLASEDTMVSSHCFNSTNIDSIGSEFCAEDPNLGDGCAAVDSNLYRFPLTHISQTHNDVSFFDNDNVDNEDEWLDIGNFEDVDRMFRNCDSTFGAGTANDDDELFWFSSPNAIPRSEEALRLGPEISSSESCALRTTADGHEACLTTNSSPSVKELRKKNTGSDYEITCHASADVLAAMDHSSEVNGWAANSLIKNEVMAEQEIPSINAGTEFDAMPTHQAKIKDGAAIKHNRKQLKHQGQLEGKTKHHHLHNGDSFYQLGSVNQNSGKHPLSSSSHQSLPSPGNCKENPKLGSNSLGNFQSQTSVLSSGYSHSSEQFFVSPSSSSVKVDNNGCISVSRKESSYASSQVHSIDSSQDPSSVVLAVTNDEKRAILYSHQELQASSQVDSKYVNSVVQSKFPGTAVQKNGHLFEIEVECNCDFGTGKAAELESSNIQKSSCMSSVMDDISVEANSFHQLQQVMEKLDIRTKLCIRDSLYRLAQSAEQRHNCGSQNSANRHHRDSNGALMTEETNKCAGFMDMETDTNPIDRSIAHLLFHRPSDPSLKPAHDTFPMKSHSVIQGSIKSLPMKAEEMVSEEEGAGCTYSSHPSIDDRAYEMGITNTRNKN